MKVWITLLIIYTGFFLWYTDIGGELDSEEISFFLEKVKENNPELKTEMYESMKNFMEEDTGRQFLMVNIIDMNENPKNIEGAKPGESAESLMNRYMEHMFPQLFKRACHPIFLGVAIAPSMDLAGIEGAEIWEQNVLMRYKSRRAFMEVVSHPNMLGKHKFKIAALEKTIAFPVETVLYLSDPRLIIGLIFLIFGLFFRLRTKTKL